MDVYQNVVFKEKVPPRPPPPPPSSSSLSTSTLEEFFPAENTEADDTSQQWLYSFMEDCLSSTTNYNHSITTTHNHHQQPQHPKPPIQTPTVLPSSSKSRNKRRKFISEFPFEMITTELPPLLHDYHPFWLADSELLAPPKKIPNEGGTSSPLVETVVSEQKQLEEEEEEEEEEDGEDEEEEEKGVVQPTEPRRCSHCLSQRTPQWRAGPLGPKTLCNACGVRFKSGRLLPEYRPAKSPTFESIKHSNSHKKVMEMRKMTLKLCSQ